MREIELRVPDIGDFKDVPVIELLVKPGDAVQLDDPLLTLESDKATIEMPSPEAGIIRTLNVGLGDRVSQGDLVGTIEVAATAPQTAAQGTGAKAEAQKPQADETDCDVLVLGGGPGGYSAAFRAADLGLKTILVERYPVLGGVCLNVGCIPSKALLHAAFLSEEAMRLAVCGITFAPPQYDIERLRGWKEKVVGKLTNGLQGLANARNVKVVQGFGRFVDAHRVAVAPTGPDGQDMPGAEAVIRFKNCIIAVGSSATRLDFLPKDPRIVSSTGALQLPHIPKNMLVIGGGIIGLEMATVYSALGARIDVVEMQDKLMLGADRDLVAIWMKKNARRFNRIMLKTRVIGAQCDEDGIQLRFDGADAPAAPAQYDLVLESIGRSPNGTAIEPGKAGIGVSAVGSFATDAQMRTNIAHIFAIGDVTAGPMLAHKAVHQAHVAAEAAAGQKSHFDARIIPNVAYTDPEVAWLGLTETEAKQQAIDISVSRFPWSASGRAIANGRDEGVTKLIFDKAGHIVGGGIVGTGAGDLISEIALAIEMGADALDIAKTIHPHPTLGETVGMASEVQLGSCTDLLPTG